MINLHTKFEVSTHYGDKKGNAKWWQCTVVGGQGSPKVTSNVIIR